MLAPHPSFLTMLINYHLRVLNAPWRFFTHLIIIYTLTFLSFCSLIAVVVRDPGSANGGKPHYLSATGEGEEIDLHEALLNAGPPNDGALDEHWNSPGKWCGKCWAPKPERAHHCSTCGRCTLKMDHHCAWLGHKCLGHRTYGSFIHFLFCIVCEAAYIACLSISAVYFAFTNPEAIDETTPVHEMALAFAGIVFCMVIGPFFLYHCYLITTNQTTLENISPFFILRQLPTLPHNPSSTHKLSNPPLEHELSYRQRRLVREANGHIRLYDVGWYQNWAQIFGWDSSFGWARRIVYGGQAKGDGRTFPRNPKAEDMLSRLAIDLVEADKDR